MKVLKPFTSLIFCVSLILFIPITTLATTKSDILSYLEASNKNVSVFYENLETGDTITFNTQKIFPAASTIKLPLVLYIYHLAYNEKLDLDDTLTYTTPYYYEGTGIIRYEPFDGTYSKRELAEYSMIHSDNIAYSMLRSHVGNTNFHNYLNYLGGEVFKTKGHSYINAVDFMTYIKAYYDFIVISPELGAELDSYWKSTMFNDHIPQGVPHLEVGHKIGSLPRQNLYHDGGVVYHDQPYALVILSQGMSPSEQENFFKETTMLVNDYHQLNYDHALEEQILIHMTPVRTFTDSLGISLVFDPNSNKAIAYIDGDTWSFDLFEDELYIDNVFISDELVNWEGTLYISNQLLEHLGVQNPSSSSLEIIDETMPK